MIGGGKDGVLHLVNTSNMGHLGDANAVQGVSDTATHPFNEFWNGNLYLWGQEDFMRVYSLQWLNLQHDASMNWYARHSHIRAELSLFLRMARSNGILWAATNCSVRYRWPGCIASTVPGILHACISDNMNLLWTNQQDANVICT